eukprot:Phypoly_transcript_23324.p1 GENE.Phypoly_transcript_23324~~Phypoly_transcript_23324.p1  ORF type:complete len:174 (+),score=17.79 Phypoly_transcript_23324:58-522(+)
MTYNPFDAQLICEKIWLGSEDAAHSSLEILKAHNISHILTVGFGLSQIYKEDLVCFQVPAIDLEIYNISKDLQKSIVFIDKALQDGTGVLIHCARGVSRSASIVIGYLIQSRNISYEEAYDIVRKARPIISPNQNFKEQLRAFAISTQKRNLPP